MGKEGSGRVALVLGAGNQVAVAALDILHQLIIEDCVVVCKMNPVNEYYGPYIRCVLGLGAMILSSKLACILILGLKNLVFSWTCVQGHKHKR